MDYVHVCMHIYIISFIDMYHSNLLWHLVDSVVVPLFEMASNNKDGLLFHIVYY